MYSLERTFYDLSSEGTPGTAVISVRLEHHGGGSVPFGEHIRWTRYGIGAKPVVTLQEESGIPTILFRMFLFLEMTNRTIQMIPVRRGRGV
jgi:hypothetical protein